ncbi:hypothetical protein NDU88_001496 [Pleurodeles waltl]|uniref:Uncharacterized protein n=1 Tax=Pleurodeles waltl TaxID=8319 RepID=A0AAV7ML29_PLEWA|nr:hypothetical protein NDU88_001496 [Pleurodeles waltl]
MLPKGAKAELPAVRGKQTRMSAARRPGASGEVKLLHEVKCGTHAKLEDDVGSQKAIGETMEKQLFGQDAQWKLTDYEDRLRRNNLRVLGIPEGVEGSDPHGL